MTINQKFLVYSFSVLVVITFMVSALLFTVAKNEKTLKFNYENVTVTSTQIFEVSSSVRAIPFLMAAVMADMYSVAGGRARIIENKADLNKEFITFKKKMDTMQDKMDAKTKEQYMVLVDYIGKLNIFVNNVVNAYEANNMDAVEEYLNDEWPDIQPPLYKALKYFVKYFESNSEKTYKEAVDQSKLFFMLAVILGTVVLALMIIGTFIFARSIIKPVSHIVDLLNSSSKNLTNTSVQMLDASNRLASSSDEQAAATQESVASMQKMASMIDQTSDHSKKSENVTDGVIQMTEKGGNIMNDMVGAMKEIKDENQKMKKVVDIFEDISKKTNVINDIVFKTQLLSFNASIEAARAGQHGKGFAVVAEEVGSLAAMSGTAAREIHSLLEDSHKRVQTTVNGTDTVVSRGNKVVDDAQSIFKQIADSIMTINDQIKKIVDASEEQSKGVEQTEAALSQLDSTARENADIATKAHTYSNELSREKDQLINIMGRLNTVVHGLKGASIADKTKLKVASRGIIPDDTLDAAELENDFLENIDHKKV